MEKNIDTLNQNKEELKNKIDDLIKTIKEENFTINGSLIAGSLALILGNMMGMAQYGANIVPIAISTGIGFGILIPFTLVRYNIIKRSRKEIDTHTAEIEEIEKVIKSLEKEVKKEHTITNDYVLDYFEDVPVKEEPLVLKRTLK